jgi:Protein of unknown function (DUF3489)
LPFLPIGVIHVVTAVIAAQGENMFTSTVEETAQATSEQPKAAKKARIPARSAHVAPAKGKSGKKPTAAKKAANAPKSAKGKGARVGCKTAQILELLKRPGGATLQNLMTATEWQAHSLRGFLSGTLRKKMGLSVESTKGEDGQRSYSLKS